MLLQKSTDPVLQVDKDKSCEENICVLAAEILKLWLKWQSKVE